MTLRKKSNSAIFLLLFIIMVAFSVPIYAAEDSRYNDDEADNTLNYYLGSAVNTGKDNGYSKANELDDKDPHYGWKLGTFFISGHTRVNDEDKSDPIFLKNAGDNVALWFTLNQDINKLNNNGDLSISHDKKGYDKYFGIEKTDFGRGTLIVRHTDYQNLDSDPVIYKDYLSALTAGADTKVDLFEEGDYEVALDYEIKNDPRKVFGLSVIPEYNDYRIYFKFSVRNGNCMVFPFDVSTGEELSNTSITENGFYLDLAKSRYLDINIKKEILKDGADGLVEDTRYNRPAKDGDKYTDEGVYIITVCNRYTNEQTEKKIYVGTDSILKAHVMTNMSIREIEDQVALGATINEDGTIDLPAVTEQTQIQESKTDQSEKSENHDSRTDEETAEKNKTENVSSKSGSSDGSITSDNIIIYIIIGCTVLAIVGLSIILLKKKSHRKLNLCKEQNIDSAEGKKEIYR